MLMPMAAVVVAAVDAELRRARFAHARQTSFFVQPATHVERTPARVREGGRWRGACALVRDVVP